MYLETGGKEEDGVRIIFQVWKKFFLGVFLMTPGCPLPELAPHPSPRAAPPHRHLSPDCRQVSAK